MQENLKAKTVSGMIWSALQRFGTMGISFVSNIVLARLLTPDDYGCIGMLAIFITVSNTFVNGGFGSALIQKKEPTEKDYSTIFWWNLFISIVLYGVLFISAPAISRFYNIPLLESVLKVQGIVLIINAFNIVQTNQLRKTINFKRLATIHIASNIIAATIAIVLAYMSWGVWALVAQRIIANLIASILLLFMNRWVPSLCFSIESFKQLFNFGSFILASNLINTFCNNIQGLLIGKFFNPATMGYYTQASKLEEIASHSISSVVDQVSYPIFSKLQSDNNSMKNAIKKITLSLSYITFPMMMILILVAEPLIMLVYGEQWLPCISYFQILCIGGIAMCIYNIHYFTVAAKGESKKIFYWTVIKRSIGIAVLVIGFYFFDVIGLICGCAITSWIILFINMYLVSKCVNYKLFTQIKDIFPIIILSVFCFCISYIFSQIINFNIYIKGTIILIFYFFSYITLSLLFRLKAFLLLKNIIAKYNIIKY